MSTVRQEQVNSVIQKTLGEIILEEMEFPREILVTVSRVDASPSLEDADVYITVLPKSETENVLIKLRKHVYHIQKLLDKNVILKFVPKIVFKEDHDQELLAEVDEILDSISEE